MPDSSPQTSLTAFLNTPLAKILSIGFLILLFQIPVQAIRVTIDERSARRDTVAAEISTQWGGTQAIQGPVLVLPYEVDETSVVNDVQTITRPVLHYAFVLPATLHVTADLSSEIRSRAIFDVPVYQTHATLTGRFDPVDLDQLGILPEQVDWNGVHVRVGVRDAHALRSADAIQWDGQSIEFRPGAGPTLARGDGLHAFVARPSDAEAGTDFSFRMELNGSRELSFLPIGQDTFVEIEGNWPSPSFSGRWLPDERTVTDEGFSAQWRVEALSRNSPAAWTVSGTANEETQLSSLRMADAQFGVRLAAPVDLYRLTERSVKYAALFFVLTFAALWLFEVRSTVRVHTVQYILVGAAIAIFYLLELSLAEHLGFGLAYTLAVIGVVIAITGYASALLKSAARVAGIGALLVGLYANLYLLLINPDSALAVGTLFLFGALCAVMYFTRNVDWYRPQSVKES